MTAFAEFPEVNQPGNLDQAEKDIWGPILLGGLETFSRSLAGQASVSLGSSSQVLSTTENQTMCIVCTGTLTANRSLSLVTGRKRRFLIRNTTSGNFTVSVQNQGGSGTAVVVPQGCAQWVYHDGSNVYAAGPPVHQAGGAPDSIRIGTVPFAGPGMFFGSDPAVGFSKRGTGIMGVGLNEAALGDMIRFNPANTAAAPLIGLGTGTQSDGFDSGLYMATQTQAGLTTNGTSELLFGGGLVAGASVAGGARGPGTVNASNFFVNGQPTLARSALFTDLSANANAAAQAGHGLGSPPISIQGTLRCVAGNKGYTTGMRVSLSGLYGVAVGYTNTTLIYQVAATGIEIPNFSTGTVEAISNGAWVIDIRLFY